MLQNSKSHTRQKKSIPFVYQSEKGLEIHPEALELLSTLPQKNCHILTIVGKAKTGKSALMNHLISKFTASEDLQEYFPVSDNLGGGTKGINIFTKFVELDDNNILLFLDAEGLGRCTNSQNYESKLFTVSLLLSTTLIYNNVGPIDEPALQNLSLFIQVGKMFEKSLYKSSSMPQMPCLFLVLRDFSLKLENKGGQDITAKEYMENALQEQKGSSQTVFHKNRIRRTIKELFKQRYCQTLVLPSDDLPIHFKSKLRPQFQIDLCRLSHRMFEHMNQNEIKHRMLTPNQISLYLRELLESVNMNIRIPRFQSILSSVYKKQIGKVKDQFKESVYKLTREFDRQASNIENIINSVRVCEEFQSNFIDDEISKLENLRQALNESYYKARQQIQSLISKQVKDQREGSFKNQHLLDTQELKILQSTKNQKEQQIKKKIRDLRQIAALNKKIYIQQQLQKQQTAEFKKIIDELCSTEEEKELEKKYRNFIYALRDRCSKINSKQFEAGLLKCQVAFLRRKLELKQRSNSNLCFSCKMVSNEMGKTSQTVLKDKLNTTDQYMNETSFSNNLKFTTNCSKQIEGGQVVPSKSFYVPYIILNNPEDMSVQIIRTLIKQDSKMNNYVEYVLEVVLMNRRWMFNRKWKDFNELHSILTSLFHQIQLPSFVNAQLSLNIHLDIHKDQVQERRQNLEYYLRKLLSIQAIRNSRIMQKFMKINKEYVPTV